MNVTDIKVGYSYVMPHRRRRVHIRAIVDGRQVVYAFYGKRKQWWHYEVHSLYYIGLMIDSNQFDLRSCKKTPDNLFPKLKEE
jgi:hypothetical protein